jgi:hypothetical protein
VAGKEDIDTELMQLVLAILNSADNLKTNGHLKWKSSIMQTVVSTAVMSRQSGDSDCQFSRQPGIHNNQEVKLRMDFCSDLCKRFEFGP